MVRLKRRLIIVFMREESVDELEPAWGKKLFKFERANDLSAINNLWLNIYLVFVRSADVRVPSFILQHVMIKFENYIM